MAIVVTSNEPKEAATAEAPKAQGLAQIGEVDNSASEAESTDESHDESESDASESETLEAKEGEEKSKDDSDDESDDGSTHKKPKSGFKKRIDKLSRRAAEAEREAQYWREQAMKGQKPEAPVETQKESKAPEGKPHPDQFETHAEFVEALTDWKVEERERKAEEQRRTQEARTAEERMITDYNQRVKDFKKDHKDFQEVIDNVSDVEISVAVKELILGSEIGPAIAYELAQDPDEFERICQLPAMAAARAIGKIEARLDAHKSESDKKETKTTKAPQPIKPLSANAAGSARKSIFDPNISQAEYERLRRDQMRKRTASW
jgi:hypothetical protein